MLRCRVASLGSGEESSELAALQTSTMDNEVRMPGHGLCSQCRSNPYGAKARNFKQLDLSRPGSELTESARGCLSSQAASLSA